MECCVEHSTIRFSAYNTRILKHVHSSIDVHMLQQDLKSVILRAMENNVVLHEDKFEHIVHRHIPNSLLLQLPPVNNEHFVYTVSSYKQLRPVSSLKNLAVNVYSNFSWSPQVNKIATKAESNCFLGSLCIQSQR